MILHRDPLTGRARLNKRQPADSRNTVRHRGYQALAALLTAAASVSQPDE